MTFWSDLPDTALGWALWGLAAGPTGTQSQPRPFPSRSRSYGSLPVTLTVP
ncbi:hypothetical protein JOD66_004851 [Nocardioides nitrophenolicus]|nr:hypothetical protein [Nocardioides nitrophenolicus]